MPETRFTDNVEIVSVPTDSFEPQDYSGQPDFVRGAQAALDGAERDITRSVAWLRGYDLAKAQM